jgi:predicted Zn-dependent protease
MKTSAKILEKPSEIISGKLKYQRRPALILQTMANTKTRAKENTTDKKPKIMANENVKHEDTPEELYATALNLVEQSQPNEALQNAQKLWRRVQDRGISEQLPALNLLGEINVELGEVEIAKGFFEKAVALDPEGKVPETMGGGAEKFLWLAQLCDEGGMQSVQWFEKGAKALQAEIEALEAGGSAGMDEGTLLLMRMEKKRKLANALCGIVEVYMTDLSWEDDAEARCENLVTEAIAVEEETSPEVLQTLASVRLSQERKDDAQAALQRSIDTWKDLEPEDPGVPDFATRISLSRLLMEAEMEAEAIEVLNRLVQEDDQSVEAWYLGGWCQNLIAEREKSQPNQTENGNDCESDRTQNLEAALKGSRHWLKTSMKLYELLDYEDERLYKHAQELVAALNTVLGPEDEQADGVEEEYGDEWDGIEDDDESDEEMKDA